MLHTIIIPTKDRPIMLKRAVSSALCALEDGGEVLVIDDRSSTPAAEALSEVTDPRTRIYVNQYQGGVSGARNFGMSKARGEIVFFLDDDDEICANYCRKILEMIKTTSPAPDYGFSAYENISDTDPETAKPDVAKGRVRFENGFIPTDAPLKKKTFGFGMGFWINRTVFQEIGDIDEKLIINEDTEYSCRLLSHNKNGWYSSDPGVRLHSHNPNVTNETSHITDRISSSQRAECCLYLCNKYPLEFRHLGFSYVKHCVKSGRHREAWGFSMRQSVFSYRIHLYIYILTKLVVYKLTGKLVPKS